MSKMDICTCMITLAGDSRTKVFRGPNNPMTYPEVNLMMFMHGDRYVTDIKVIRETEMDNATELDRLRVKYGSVAYEAFPGQRPKLPFEAPDDIPRDLIPEPETPEPEPEEEVVEEGAHTSPARRRRPAKVA